ncbi:hypothetical protein NQ315_008919 [Exocentrus adspersus]|uniref:DDE Tnp4 domain-containing protein n=1 Tax=Exocentrus adspersus TaxID=1586481 RepID=A0AAV8VCA8_9CUCU|nr:hypothetical protein NQ315_008919 [Exocentrus adspersus]
MLAALRFFASGSYQLDIGRNRMASISQLSTSRSIHEIIECINQPEILNRFPGIIGCIDGTHVAIVTPYEHENIYVNRKRYHSLNVQIVNSTHDSFVWQNSAVEAFLRNLPAEHQGNFYLLGYSGYPLRPWLMTPILPEPQPDTPELAYNRAMRRIRTTVEICHGRLKNRFRCLLKDRTLHYSEVVFFSQQVKFTCCVLHNIYMDNNIPLYEDNIVDEDDPDNNHIDIPVNDINVHQNANNLLDEGRRIRRLLIRNNFN